MLVPLGRVMNQNDSKPVKPGEEKTNSKPPTFFPRVIREFEDGSEEPMVYGGS